MSSDQSIHELSCGCESHEVKITHMSGTSIGHHLIMLNAILYHQPASCTHVSSVKEKSMSIYMYMVVLFI